MHSTNPADNPHPQMPASPDHSADSHTLPPGTSLELMPIILNPLVWFPGEAQRFPGIEEASAESFLAYAGRGQQIEVTKLIERYRATSAADSGLVALPASESIMRQILLPLHSAKISLLLQHYTSCIAMCGMVAEMLALLRFNAAKVTHQGQAMTESVQKAFFGSTFAKLGQDRRVQVLRSIPVITDEQEQDFDSIRLIRRRHLHFFHSDVPNDEGDAVQCYTIACKLVKSIFAIEVVDGALRFNLAVLEWAKGNGLVDVEDPPPGMTVDKTT